MHEILSTCYHEYLEPHLGWVGIGLAICAFGFLGILSWGFRDPPDEDVVEFDFGPTPEP